MRLSWGSYQFDVNATLLSQREVALFNVADQPYARKLTVDVQGYLVGDGQAAITAQMNAMAAALRVNYQDLVFKADNGSEAYHVLRNAGSISGVRVVQGPDFPQSTGPEFATLRTFAFSVEGEFPINGSAALLVAFDETLDFGGGGPLYVHKPALNGPPQKQMVYQQVPFWAVQRGSAVGYRAYPAIPAPLFPGDLKERGRFSRKTPKRRGNGYQDFGITWEYNFESVSQLAGVPRLWLG